MVMRLEISGGMALGHGFVIALLGSGGLVYEEMFGRKRRERFGLLTEEVDELVRTAVKGVLIGLDWPSLQPRLK